MPEWLSSTALAGLLLITAAAAQPRPEHTVYVTVGDSQWLVDWTEPLDSRATVEAAMESYRNNLWASRVFWRGQQDEQWLENHVFRPENRMVYDWWQWVKHLNYEVGTNRIAVEAAHRQSMQIMMVTGLFDWGSQPDAGGMGMLPYVSEHRLRARQPEYAPVNRYGTRHQGGLLEFAYPEVRRAAVQELTEHVLRYGYDGLVLYTYVENMSLRYPDEFGYSDPIVREFRRRYGVDIRTQEFDREAWARLKGEYVTAFLRELKGALARHRKELAVYLNPDDTHAASIWNTNAGPVVTAGHIYLDWERWAGDGLVDELVIGPFGKDSDRTTRDVLAACAGTKVRVTQFRSKGDLAAPGVTRLVFPGKDDVESGFDFAAAPAWGEPFERTPEQPLENLRSDDAQARRRVLWLAAVGRQAVPIADLAAATRDRDVYCRILAVRALGSTRQPEAVPAIEAALDDPENAVRIQATIELSHVHGPDSLRLLLEALFGPEATWQFQYVAAPPTVKKLAAAGAFDPAATQSLVARLKDRSPENRRLAVQVLRDAGLGADPAVQAALQQALKADRDERVRELALSALADRGGERDVLEMLLAALDDRAEHVQIVAARRLGGLVAGATSLPDMRQEALERLTALFGQFGDRSRRTDRDWAWRDIGNLLLQFGPEGEAAVRAAMDQRRDRRLADLAWQVLYIRQLPDAYVSTTPEEDAQAHAARPRW
ncbi:MAG: family 10 glycosylhydrolase [Armatimonadetes bacterium]|nr:family 10 glycosylhydrolase [Armatimonadota bacterium]